MKVVKEGTPVPWWVGQQGTCDSCGAVVEFEAVDERDPSFEQDETAATIACPCCPEYITLNRHPVI